MSRKERVYDILTRLNQGLYEREEIIAITLLSALSNQNIFLYGPPGTAKSLISRRLSKAFNTQHYFEHLMQKFSTPEEVFGPISITELKKDNYIRKTDGFLPTAEFSFLDEIWKSSPAILNTLLTIINEKKFKNGTNVDNVPINVLISASNETPPKNQGLEALYDRFLTRILVPPVSDRNNFENILQSGSSYADVNIPDSLQITKQELAIWKDDINKIQLSEDTLNIINGIRVQLDNRNKKSTNNHSIYISDRRWQRSATLMKASAYFCDRDQTNIADCLLLKYCLWSDIENREEISDIIETVIKESGFKTNIPLLDTEKNNLEDKINKEIYHSSHVYDSVILTRDMKYFDDEYNEDEHADGEQDDEVNNIFKLYIPQNYMKTNDIFHPVDKSGHEYKWMKGEFDDEGTCHIKISEEGRHNAELLLHEKYYNKSITFKPKILFRKGDRKEDVSPQLREELASNVSKISDKTNKMLAEIHKRKSDFMRTIETPFLTKKQLEVTLSGINEQIESLEVCLKDCERLALLVE